MKSQKRKTGFRFLKDCDWGTHICLLYQGKEELKHIMVPYVQAGLQNNEFCLWITSEIMNRTEVIETMKTEVPNFEQYLNSGQMEIVPYTEWYLKKDKFDQQRVIGEPFRKLTEAQENGFDGIRISSDTSFLEGRSFNAFYEYESQLNNIIDKYNILAICSYPVDTLDTSEIINIVDNHRYSLLKRKGKWRVIRSKTLQQQSDELQKTSARLEVLQQITEDVHGSLDISEILQGMTDICINSLGYTTAFIMMMDQTEGLFKLKHLAVKEHLLSSINKTIGFPLKELTAPADLEYNQSFRSLLSGEMVVGDKLSTIAYPLLGKRTCSVLQKLAGTNSYIALPIMIDDSIAGVVFVSSQAETVTEEEMQTMRYLSRSASIALKNASFCAEISSARESIKNSESLFRSIAEASSDYIVQIDNQGKITYASPAVKQIIGYEPDELIGEFYFKHIPKSSQFEAQNLINKLREVKQFGNVEIEILHKDGKTVPAEISGALITQDGKANGMLAIIKDITERKRIEENLRKSEIFSSSLLNNSPNPIIVITPDSSIGYVNNALEKLTGYSSEELVRKKAPYPFWIEANIEKCIEGLKKDLRHGVKESEFQFCKKNGNRFWVRITSMPVKIDGKFYYLISSWTDITESKKAEEALRESEEKYRNLVQNAPIGITVSTAEGKIIDINRTLLEMHGYDSREEFNRIPVDQRYYNPEDRKQWQKLVREKGVVRGFEIQLKRKDGTLFWASMSSIPQMDGDGEQRYMVVIQDITEHKREERLQQGENYILTLIGQNAELNKILDAIIRLGEESDPLIIGSVLLYDHLTGLLHYASGPNLPDNFRQQLKQGLPIGPNVGSCGTAAYRKERVIVQNIENSPLFKEHEEAVRLVTGNALFACWSQPIISTNGELLGTIANYSNKVGEPSAESIKVLEWSSRIAAITIERKRAEEELLLRAQLLDNASDGICLFNLNGEYLYVNDMYCKVHGCKRPELIGMNIREIDTNATDEWLERLKKELKEKGVVVFESVHHRKDGSLINLEVYSTEIEVGGIRYNLSVERDITKRKQSEESLRESELFNSNLLENSPNPIVVINADTSIRYVNPALVRLTGYSFEELVNIKPPYPYWKKEETIIAATRLKEDMIHGVKDYEIAFNRKNGETFWVSITNTPIKSGDTLEYLLSTWVDITESKKAREALKESEEKYRSLVQNTLAGVYIEAKGRFVYVNPEFQQLTGYSEEELLNMKADDIIHSDDKILVRTAAADMLEKKRNIPYEFRIITASGMTRWAMETVTSINYMGEKASLGSIMDITERKRMETALKESEEKFSEVFYASPKPMTIIAPDTGIINDVNKVFSNSSGFTRKECLGKTITELGMWVSEADRRIFIQNLSEQESVQNFETEMCIKSGEIRNVLLSTTMITIADKPYIIISLDDITEQRKMQENLIVTDRLASVGELAAGIAHELNNPLTGVIGFSDLLMARNDLPQDIREDLGIVNREALRASQVARHLLTFARKHPDEKKQININDVLLLVLELRAYEQRVNNIEVVTNLDANLPYVLANDFQLQQAFINIIINAEHFMIETNDRGKLEITTEKRGNSVITTIADDGPGIPPEHLKRIFDPFFTTKEVGKGTGLGLSICHGIITEHGGMIRAESEYGKGATFIIELPHSTTGYEIKR